MCEFSENTGTLEAKFHEKPPWDRIRKFNLNGPAHLLLFLLTPDVCWRRRRGWGGDEAGVRVGVLALILP